MTRFHYGAIAPLLLAQFAISAPAHAETKQSLQVVGETQDYSEGMGSQRSVTIEYKRVTDDTTIVFTPSVGTRRLGTTTSTAYGAGLAIYQDWSDSVSTRTGIFVAEDKPVFTALDFSQDVTFKVAQSATVTLGGRWARYFGNRDVSFVSLGTRRYFKGGSAAYRLSWIQPEGNDGFFGHLVNLTINDGHGAGKTQLWLSSGSSELDRNQPADGFARRSYATMLKRTQPLTSQFALIAGAGVSSYARPAGRVTATNLELGLQIGLD
jgi:YaiO family outer membrane protein